MKYTELQKIFGKEKLFSLSDIRKYDPQFSSLQLNRWQKKGYIIKMISKWYIFSDTEVSESFLFTLSNRILKPSYISLHSALSYYHFIPEGVFTITAISSEKTYRFHTPYGNLSYQKISPKLFWGYSMVGNIRIAEPEKALLDFLLMNPQYKNEDDFFELRFNISEILENIDQKKFHTYSKAYQNKALLKRAETFFHFLCSHSEK